MIKVFGAGRGAPSVSRSLPPLSGWRCPRPLMPIGKMGYGSNLDRHLIHITGPRLRRCMDIPTARPLTTPPFRSRGSGYHNIGMAIAGFPATGANTELSGVVSDQSLIPSALYNDPRVAAESSCRRRSASTSFPAVISKDVDGGPPPAMTITTNRRVNDFAAWY